jgi:hypothetical protein
MKVRLEILKCKACGRLCFGTGGQSKDDGGKRLSSHKCAGQWQVLASEVFDLSDIADEAFEP